MSHNPSNPSSTPTHAPWPHKADIAIKINPAKKKQIQIILCSIVGVLSLGILLASLAQPSLERLAMQTQNNKDALLIQPLADAGSQEASLWMALNMANEAWRLDDLVQQQNPRAMLALAKLKWATNQEEAKDLVKAAAKLGEPTAVLYLNQQGE